MTTLESELELNSAEPGLEGHVVIKPHGQIESCSPKSSTTVLAIDELMDASHPKTYSVLQQLPPTKVPCGNTNILNIATTCFLRKIYLDDFSLEGRHTLVHYGWNLTTATEEADSSGKKVMVFDISRNKKKKKLSKFIELILKNCDTHDIVNIEQLKLAVEKSDFPELELNGFLGIGNNMSGMMSPCIRSDKIIQPGCIRLEGIFPTESGNWEYKTIKYKVAPNEHLLMAKEPTQGLIRELCFTSIVPFEIFLRIHDRRCGNVYGPIKSKELTDDNDFYEEMSREKDDDTKYYYVTCEFDGWNLTHDLNQKEKQFPYSLNKRGAHLSHISEKNRAKVLYANMTDMYLSCSQPEHVNLLTKKYVVFDKKTSARVYH